jgi:hypothetical protein
VAVVLATGGLASGAFHFALIDEVMSGVGADPSVQYVEIRMLSAGQILVADTRLTIFSCDGTTKTQLLLVPSNVGNSGVGTRWIMATPSFAAAACINPDFTFTPPGGHPGIFPTCGMVCWGAPYGTFPPPPASWNLEDPDQYIDCLAYGGYTGPVPSTGYTTANAADFLGGTMSLTRSGGSTRFNSQEFAPAAPTPRNNAGLDGTLGATCPTPTTSTTTPGASTTSTTTTVTGGPTTTLAPPLAGGAPKKTDCYGEWILRGAPGGKPVLRCKDGDTSCDTSAGPGCVVQGQLCFNDTANPIYRNKCASAPVQRFEQTSQTKDQVDLDNWDAMGTALAGLGSRITAPAATFETPITSLACTAPFELSVPLRTRGARSLKGVRTIVTATSAGKIDRDSVKIICLP